jgi:hypothetical protein
MTRADRELVVGSHGRKIIDAVRRATTSSYDVTDAVAEIERIDPTTIAELEEIGAMLVKIRSTLHRLALTVS